MENPEAKRKENENPNPSPPWLELPDDVTANILQRLGAVEVLENAQEVCTHWRRVSKLPSTWRMIDMRNPANLLLKLGIMCRHAVDRSQGQLVDINIEYFGTDELLLYIAERSKNLKCLKLRRCRWISSKGLAKAAERFPELEELQLISRRLYLTDEDIESIGISCPMLKSFTYNTSGCTEDAMNGSAFAIAKSMPNLHHLGLCYRELDDEGLRAILDGCPHLESIDIRGCQHIALWGDLGKRCSEQIKCLRHPGSTYDGFSDNSECSSYDDYCNCGGVSSDDDGISPGPGFFLDYYGIDTPPTPPHRRSP